MPIVSMAAALASVPAGAAETAVARPSPVVVIVMENHSYDQIAGSPDAPYLARFAAGGTLFTNYWAVEHPSLPNYLDMTAGTNAGCRSNRCPRQAYHTNNVFHQLQAAGIAWRSYQESMPRPCALTSSGRYAVKHNPVAYFTNLRLSCGVRDVPMPTTIHSTLPGFTFVTPNLCSDMHSCSIATGDRWLGANVPAFLATGAVVVIVFDEGFGSNHVFAAARGPGIRIGVDSARYNHFGLLAGIELHFGLARLHGAAGARSVPM